MGTFHGGARVENLVDRSKGASLPTLLVDTGSGYTWVPEPIVEKLGIAREKKDLEFVMANGQKITRSVGFAIVRVDKSFTVDEVVFAEKGDLLLLGARSLEGLSLMVDSRQKKFGCRRTTARGLSRSAPPDQTKSPGNPSAYSAAVPGRRTRHAASPSSATTAARK